MNFCNLGVWEGILFALGIWVLLKRKIENFERKNCLVCEGGVENLITTSCGHKFCGECIFDNYSQGRILECPACKSQISLLLFENAKGFSNETLKAVSKFNISNVERTFYQIMYDSIFLIWNLLATASKGSYPKYWRIYFALIAGFLHACLFNDLIDEFFKVPFALVFNLLTMFGSLVLSSQLYFNAKVSESAQILLDN
ncbi:unnamed protein product [Blepharisma stoltei]|uniref:RING-type domain-containing protein n=1 Tax=Blepharisma stoltei TaxID=1481888 RepID=A0AAU9IVV6_9CILI|nr:unnamed protein product [Blepharisma stoltei]